MWLVLALVSWGLTILLVRNPGINKLWPAGVIAVAVTLLIDTTLVKLGAFQYNHAVYAYQGVPLFYIIANFANGILLVRFVPFDKTLKPIATVALAAAFLLLEWIMMQLGYFVHLNWSLWHSLGLNILGFMAVLWAADWLALREETNV